MAVDDAWIEELMARLAPLGEVSFRKMFGGVGFWERGDMFALVDSGGQLYFKVDDYSRVRYEEAGTEPFNPRTGPARPPTTMPYFEVPAEVLGDEARFAEWASEAIVAGKPAAGRRVGGWYIGHRTAKRRR